MREGEELAVGPDTYRFLEVSNGNPDAQIHAEVTMAPNAASIPSHCHPVSRELIEVLDGSLHVTIEGHDIHVGPGESYTVDPGQQHIVRNSGTERNRFLWTFSPSVDAEGLLSDTVALGAAALGQFAILRIEEYLAQVLEGHAVCAQEAFAEIGRLIDEAGGWPALIESARVLAHHDRVMAGAAPESVRGPLLNGLASLAGARAPGSAIAEGAEASQV